MDTPVSQSQGTPQGTPQDRMFVFGGRTFHRATSTSVDQDAYVTKRIRSAGLVQMWNGFDPGRERMSALIERVIFEAFEAGVMYDILAGILVEPGVRWSRTAAAANAMMFAAITDPAEKDALFANVADVLIEFLTIAAAWSPTSPRPSGETSHRANASGDLRDDNPPHERTQGNTLTPAASAATLPTTTDSGTH